MLDVLSSNLWLIATSLTVLWIFASLVRDVSWIDPFWPAGFVLIAWNSVNWPAEGPPEFGPAALTYLILVTVWGGRLCVHLLVRKFKHAGEDYRYRAMRAATGPNFWYRSLLTVFLLQGLLMWTISLPIQAGLTWHATAAQLSAANVNWTYIAALGLWLVGFLIEAISDFQLTRFQSRPANRGRVLATGCWRYSRHPNYFGECCVWWAFYLLTCSISWQLAWTVFSPVLMTVLLLKVSGVVLLEKTISLRRPDYADYVRTTSSFVPWWPRTPHKPKAAE